MRSLHLAVALCCAGLASGQIMCLLEHCKKVLFECETDPVCKVWQNCVRGCKPASNITCQVRVWVRRH